MTPSASRISRSTSSPEASGRVRSSSSRSGWLKRQSRSASEALGAGRTPKRSAARWSQSSSRVGASSSQTTRLAISVAVEAWPPKGAAHEISPPSPRGNLQDGACAPLQDAKRRRRQRAPDLDHRPALVEEVEVESEAHAEGVDARAARDQQPRPPRRGRGGKAEQASAKAVATAHLAAEDADRGRRRSRGASPRPRAMPAQGLTSTPSSPHSQTAGIRGWRLASVDGRRRQSHRVRAAPDALDHDRGADQRRAATTSTCTLPGRASGWRGWRRSWAPSPILCGFIGGETGRRAAAAAGADGRRAAPGRDRRGQRQLHARPPQRRARAGRPERLRCRRPGTRSTSSSPAPSPPRSTPACWRSAAPTPARRCRWRSTATWSPT